MEIKNVVKNISHILNTYDIVHNKHNGEQYYKLSYQDITITVHTEGDKDKIRILFKFKHSRKTYYIDHLIRFDKSLTKELPAITIPIKEQLSYLRTNINHLINEDFCEDIMSNFKYDEQEFINMINGDN